MSIATEISRLRNNVTNALTAIGNKGVTVPAGSKSDDLADLISEIETGGEITITDQRNSAGGIDRSIDTGINKIKRIVKGTAPLSLTMVKPGPMTRLTQYGKIELIGTPSPTSPATIKCNNGTLTAIESELPSEYRRVLDLTMANARFVTTTYLTGDDTLRFSASGRPGNWIGAYNSGTANDNYSFYAATGTTAKYMRYDGEAHNSSIVNDTRYDIEITPTGSSGNRTPESWTQKSFTCSIPLCIGATSPEGTAAPNVTFYGNIEVDGVATFIPCERLEDHKLGYFDTSVWDFLEDVEGGTVTTSGYDYSYLDSWDIIGTDEEITIGNTTAGAISLCAVGDHRDEQDIISGGYTARTFGMLLSDGRLSWQKVSGVNIYHCMPVDQQMASELEPGVSSHFVGTDEATADMPDNSIKCDNGRIYIRKNDTTTVADFEAFLQAQLAAGTPVIAILPQEDNTYSITAQPITLSGDTTVTMTAEISGIEIKAEYEGQVGT